MLGVSMEVADLLSKTLSIRQRHCVAAIIGSLVADAAAQPIHWVYAGMEKVLEGVEHPEFRPTSANPYYTIATGNQSPYGDLLLSLLESLAECGRFDATDAGKRMMKAFGTNSPYDNNTTKLYSKGMRDKSMFPIQSKWRSFLLTRFTEYYPTGRTLEDYPDIVHNVDPDNIVRLVPLVALYAGKPEMLIKAENAIMQLQVSDIAVTVVLAACRVLEQYILHGQTEEGETLVNKVIEELKSPARVNPKSLDRAVAGHLQTALDCRAMSVQEATLNFGKQ